MSMAKSTPVAVKANHPAELKELQSTAKDIQKMLPAQRERLVAADPGAVEQVGRQRLMAMARQQAERLQQHFDRSLDLAAALQRAALFEQCLRFGKLGLRRGARRRRCSRVLVIESHRLIRYEVNRSVA